MNRDTKQRAGFALAIIGATVGAMGWFSGQISTAIAEHSKYPHAATAQRLAVGESAQAATDTSVAVQDSKLDRLDRLEAKLDVLVGVHVAEARRSPRKRSNLIRAAASSRSAAASRGTEGDPLAGLEGL